MASNNYLTSWLRLLCMLYLISISQCLQSSLKWEEKLWTKVDSSSYLHREKVQSEAINFTKDLIKVIYSKQHPKKELCTSTRFTVLHMRTTTLEGLGSILKQVQMGVAASMHSNRTLVWGLAPPFLFEHTQELWQTASAPMRIGDHPVDCTGKDDVLGGPYECFFEAISSCSLRDASPAELSDFASNPYDDRGRFLFADTSQTTRKSITVYHPPQGLFEHIFSIKSYSESFKKEAYAKKAHFWSSALAAYIFRVKSYLAESFDQHHAKALSDAETTWGLHVRHGDVKSLRNAYSYKAVFEFEDYFAYVRDLTHEYQSSPKLLYISTDSLQAVEIPSLFRRFQKQHGIPATTNPSLEKGKISKSKKNRDADFDDDDDDNDIYEDDYDDEYDDDDSDYSYDDDDYDDEDHASSEKRPLAVQVKHMSWFGGDELAPAVASTSARYGTEHGFIVNASGGCVRDAEDYAKGICAIGYQEILMYENLDENKNLRRSVRMLRTLLEAVRDVYVLSRTKRLIGTASSHFSTLSAQLIWARTGCADVNSTVHYLDHKTMVIGSTPCAYLCGTNQGDVTGEQRWGIHTNRFISGISPQRTEAIEGSKAGESSSRVKLDYNPWGPENRMKLVGGVPQLPEKVFYTETSQWLGNSPYAPVFPGQCPSDMKKSEDRMQYVMYLTNLGVHHHEDTHMGQAFMCWLEASRKITAWWPANLLPKFIQQAKDIVEGNIRALQNPVATYADAIVDDGGKVVGFFSRTQRENVDEFFENNKLLASGQMDPRTAAAQGKGPLGGAVMDSASAAAAQKQAAQLTAQVKGLQQQVQSTQQQLETCSAALTKATKATATGATTSPTAATSVGQSQKKNSGSSSSSSISGSSSSSSSGSSSKSSSKATSRSEVEPESIKNRRQPTSSDKERSNSGKTISDAASKSSKRRRGTGARGGGRKKKASEGKGSAGNSHGKKKRRRN